MDPLARFIVFSAKRLKKARDIEMGDGATFSYNFKEQYCRAVLPDGTVYIMDFDGNTQVVIGTVQFAVPGCPYPWQVGAWAYFQLFLYNHRRKLPALVLAVFLAAILQYLITEFVPASQEITRWCIPVIAMIVNIAMAAMIVAVGLMALIRACGPALVETVEDYKQAKSGQGQKALSAGLYRAGNEMILVSQEGESGPSFESRVLSAIETQKRNSKWLLVVAQGSCYIQVFIPAEDAKKMSGADLDVAYGKENFHRDQTPFDVHGLVRKGSGYVYESSDECQDYVRQICPGFIAWVEDQKMKFLNQ